MEERMLREMKTHSKRKALADDRAVQMEALQMPSPVPDLSDFNLKGAGMCGCEGGKAGLERVVGGKLPSAKAPMKAPKAPAKAPVKRKVPSMTAHKKVMKGLKDLVHSLHQSKRMDDKAYQEFSKLLGKRKMQGHARLTGGFWSLLAPLGVSVATKLLGLGAMKKDAHAKIVEALRATGPYQDSAFGNINEPAPIANSTQHGIAPPTEESEEAIAKQGSVQGVRGGAYYGGKLLAHLKKTYDKKFMDEFMKALKK